MRRLSILMSIAGCLVLLAMACSKTEPITGPQTFAAAKALAVKADKPLLINFFATW